MSLTKLNAKQLEIPLSKNVRAEIVTEIAEARANNAVEDGFESVFDLVLDGCKGVRNWTDEELIKEIKYHLDES